MQNANAHEINLHWKGPYTLETVANEPIWHDRYGIYQIYGPHPIYGNQQLLYIGKACQRTFGVRLLEHGWAKATRDLSQVSVYLGQIHGYCTPDEETWRLEIDYAERLLIHAHFPPFNTQKWRLCSIEGVSNVHVFNWDNYRDLLPEVSGKRYTDLEAKPGYAAYSSTTISPSEKDPKVSCKI